MKKRGLILGKFLPPHLGHLHLFEFAERCVDELAIVVGTLPGEPIAGSLRHAWVNELMPRARVLHLTDNNPQTPEEHPAFWEIWERSLRAVLPWEPTYVFASEPYGAQLAALWNAEFVQVDVARQVIPISGTAIRSQPMRHWHFLPRCVRPWFAKRISVFGPESTGKTTLATDLARHFGTVVVPEYARSHLERQNGQVSLKDMQPIALRQGAAEDALARSANRLLFCDTDPLLTSIWSRTLFQEVPDDVARLGTQRDYALTLLTDIDVPFVPDLVRYRPNHRQSFMDACHQTLKAANRQYVVVRGTREQRIEQAIQHIDELLERADTDAASSDASEV